MSHIKILFLCLISSLLYSEPRRNHPRSAEHIPGSIIIRSTPSSTNQMSRLSTLTSRMGRAFENHSVRSLWKNDGRIRPQSSPRSQRAMQKVEYSNLTIQELKNMDKKTGTRETLRLIQELKRQGIEAYPDYEAHANWMPNDPYLRSTGSWGQSGQDLWGLFNIDAMNAWDRNQGAGVIVAVVDTGVDSGHPDLVGRVLPGYDFVFGDFDATDENGHGSHVAGTIAATANNGIGIVGVAPQAQILPVRVLDASGSGSFSDIILGIVFAAENGARVINLSLGGYSPYDIYTPMTDAFRYAQSLGAVSIVAAGNDGWESDYSSPANDPFVVSVSAVNENDRYTSFTNYGCRIGVAAPGGGDNATPNVDDPIYNILSILSSINTIPGNLRVGSQYARLAGTSMAAPHVAGVAALVLSEHPDFSPEQVRQALQFGTNDIETPGFDPYSGFGRINALAAIDVENPLEVQQTTRTRRYQSQLNITGTIRGTGFQSWILDYRTGPNNPWINIASGLTEQLDSPIGSLDTSSLDGFIEVRLRGNRSDSQVFEHRASYERNNAPSNFRVDEVGTNFIKVSWDNNYIGAPAAWSNVVESYENHRITGLSWYPYDYIPYSENSAHLYGLESGMTYLLDVSNPSGWSNSVEVTTLVSPAKPLVTSIIPLSGRTIEIKWNDRSSNELGFYVERSTYNFLNTEYPKPYRSSVWTTVATLPKDSNQFKDSGLAPNTLYHYRVLAYNLVGPSGNGIHSARTYDKDHEYVRGLFLDVLGRNGSIEDIEFWAGSIRSGSARSTVSGAFFNSQERRQIDIGGYYSIYLKRGGSLSEISSWASQLGSLTQETVASKILAYNEYFTMNGGNNTGFVKGLYRDILKRAADSSGLTWWVYVLNSGTTRETVAKSFLTSDENRKNQLIPSWYQQYLRRSSDSDGLNYYFTKLVGGVRQEGLLAEITSSQEYYDLLRP